MGKFIFEDLQVYQKALKLSEEIISEIKSTNYKYNRIRDQLIGAIISIPLNIAEGCGRTSKKDRIQFFNFARSSSFEGIPLLEICVKFNIISSNSSVKFRNEIESISKMLSGLIKSNR